MRRKYKIIILVAICVVVLVLGIILDIHFSNKNKSNLVEISYDELVQKMENKDTFVLLISQTTCSHCEAYKPKLDKVAKEYNIIVYYIEADLLSDSQTSGLLNYFSYRGTPQTIFVIDGYEETAATRINGEATTDKIKSKFKSNGFIE